MRMSRRRAAGPLLLLVAACARAPGPSGAASPAAPDGRIVPAVEGTTPAGIAYEAEGPPTGAPVVLIHAFSLDRRQWDDEAALLRDRRRVVRYDLRGHGRSAAPTGPYTSAGDLLGVLDALGIRRAALVGLSAGARVAIDFALEHPERVSRLLLASPGLGGYVPREPMTWMAPVIAAARAGHPDSAAALWAATPIMRVPDDAAARVRDMVMDNAKLWTLASNPERPLAPPAIERLGDIRVPVLVLVGGGDVPDERRVADTLAAAIPGARELVIPGAGHLLDFTARAAFDSALVRFLREE